MKQTYYLGLLGAALLAGCHHDAEGPAYDLSGQYTAAATITPANPIQLFTAQGGVTDAAVIGRYLGPVPSNSHDRIFQLLRRPPIAVFP